MRIDLAAYDCVDFGCSGGRSIAFCKEELGGQRILGLDLDPKKVDAARAAGFDAEVADLSNPALEYTGTVRFVTMSHFLEHVPGRKEAQRCIETACRIADEFVFIRQPYFDADSYLFSLRLKLYWSDWSGHPYHMTSLDFHEMLRKLVEDDKISRYVIFFRSQIEDSHDTAIHPISSPPQQHQWEPNMHDPRPFHGFLFPVFRETGAIALMGSQSVNDEILRFLQSCTIVFDSDDPVASPEAEALSSITKLSERPDLEGVLAEHKKVKSDLEALVNSFSFRLGQMLVQAVRWPGRNTVLLPYRLVRLCLGEIKKRKRPGQVSHRQQLGKQILCRKGDCVARSRQAQPAGQIRKRQNPALQGSDLAACVDAPKSVGIERSPSSHLCRVPGLPIPPTIGEKPEQEVATSRKEELLMNLDLPKLKGVEIGPLDKAIISRNESHIRYADHLDAESLRRKYSHHGSVNTEAIPDIDLVLSAKTLVDCVGRESLDYVVASHVIEHVPDFVAFLQDMHDALRIGGVLCLAVPDNRYTFDVFRRLTSYEDVETAYTAGARRPSLVQVMEHMVNVSEIDLSLAWTDYQRALAIARRKHPRPDIPQLVRAYQSGDYLDVHCWIFNPWSFLRLTYEVCHKHNLLLGLRRFVPTRHMRNEFLVQLQRLAGFDDWHASWPNDDMAETQA